MIFTEDFILLIDDINKNRECVVSKSIQNFITISENNNKFDINYIGLDNDFITFLPQNKINKLISKNSVFIYDKIENFIEKSLINGLLSKIKVKFGRFIRKISSYFNKVFTNNEIEQFVNNAKSFLKLKGDESKFKLVYGEDIRKYYLKNSYQIQKGQLGKSCMKHETCQKYLNFYVENPEICKMLILFGSEENKIIGRALIWTTDDNNLYLDRIYTISDSDVVYFTEYAKKLNCKESYNKLFCSHINYNFIDLKINPLKTKFEYYPYMDSFRYYYPKYNKFFIEITEDSSKYYELEMTNGLLNIGDEY